MPILVPVQTLDAPEGSVLGFLIGSTELTGSLSLLRGLRGRLDGETELTGSLAGVVALAGQLDGSTDLAPAFLRINDEANIFFAGQLNGATNLTGNLKMRRGFNGLLESATELSGTLRVLHPEEASITILVDVIDAAIAGVQNIGRRYNTRLVVDGEELPIRSVTIEARPDTLGTELRVALARPEADQVSFSSNITFQIGIWTGAAFSWLTLISNGKLASRENPVRNENRLPKDEMNITVVDVIGDRWNRAPRAPIHLFDPFKVSAPDASQIESQTIHKQDGTVIAPVNTAIEDMTLRDVLHEAYVVGVGFSSVVSNLPNFPVSEADFTLDGGYDGGVRPLLQMFAPLLFEQDNALFIIDPDAPLPAGLTPRVLALSKSLELSDSRPQLQPVNAILLRLQTLSTTGGEFYTERVDTDSKSAGVFGTPGYTETTIEKRVKEWRNFATPTIVVREEEVSEETQVVDHLFNPIEVTTLTQTFDALNRKTAHSRRVAKRLPDLNNDGALELLSDVTRQEQLITYRSNPLNPKEDLQDTVTTVESGLILVDEGNTYLGDPYRIPLTEAHFSGYVDPDGDQRVEQGDIRTTTEALRARGQQVDVEIRVVNHLANAPTQTTITSRPGGIAFDRRSQAASTRTLLLTVSGTDSEGRKAQIFDAGILPAQLAIDLALRKLARLNNPPSALQLTPAFVDLSIKRGSILRVHGRNNVTIGDFIVEGYSITFGEFRREQGGSVASMSLAGRELQA